MTLSSSYHKINGISVLEEIQTNKNQSIKYSCTVALLVLVRDACEMICALSSKEESLKTENIFFYMKESRIHQGENSTLFHFAKMERKNLWRSRPRLV